MTDCAICTKHHAHEPDDDCTPQCAVVPADCGVICSGCRDRIGQGLDLVVECWALTEDPGFPTAGGEGRSKSRPLPGGDEWMDYRSGVDVFGKLGSWCQDFAETFELSGPMDGTLTGITGWLRAQLPRAAATHPAIGDFAAEVAALANRGMRIAGMTPERGSRVPCPTEECTGVLRVRTAVLEEMNRCRRCGIERATAQLLAIASRADAWVPADTAAEVARVSVATVRRWAAAGHVERVDGRYWLPSVREYAAFKLAV